jgi:hypothetical protein
MGSFGIEVDIKHDFEVIHFGLNHGGFKTIHNYLPAALDPLIEFSGKQRVNDPKEIRK